jgi:hypothetical protein
MNKTICYNLGLLKFIQKSENRPFVPVQKPVRSTQCVLLSPNGFIIIKKNTQPMIKLLLKISKNPPPLPKLPPPYQHPLGIPLKKSPAHEVKSLPKGVRTSHLPAMPMAFLTMPVKSDRSPGRSPMRSPISNIMRSPVRSPIYSVRNQSSDYSSDSVTHSNSSKTVTYGYANKSYC